MTSSLGDRMKMYESVTRTRLVPRMPTIIRLDGHAFHTLCRGMQRPYDEDFASCMWGAAMACLDQVEGCKVAYVQSDEISLLLTDYDTLQTQAWFDGGVLKITSVSASIVTGAFNVAYATRFPERWADVCYGRRDPPSFDSRCWSLPKEEVVNYFLSRQQDAERNSLSMLCQAHFSPKVLHGKGREEQHDLLHGIDLNWNNCSTAQKRGVCVIKETYEVEGPQGEKAVRSRCVVDLDIPIFGQDRVYIQQFVDVDLPESCTAT